MDTNERKIKKKGLGNGGIRPRPFLIAMFVVLATAALTLSACTRSMSVEALPTTPTTIAGTAWPKSTPTQTSSRYAPIQVTVSPNAEGYNIKINSELLVPANTWIFLVTKRGNETWVLLNSRTNYNWTLKWSFQTSEVMDIFDGRKLQSGLLYDVFVLSAQPGEEVVFNDALHKRINSFDLLIVGQGILVAP